MKINNIDIKKFLNFEETLINKEEDKVSQDLNFGNILNNTLSKVNNLQLESDNLKEQLAIGELDNLHDLTIASEKANVALQATMSIRTKIVEAYKEIMRIQI